MRIQVEVDEHGIRAIERVKAKAGLATYKDVFNNALSLLIWALGERENGRIIASLDEVTREYKELHMPALEHALDVARSREQDQEAA